MIPLTMVMFDLLGNRPSEMAFTERDHAVEAFVFDRAHEALRPGICVGRLKRVCTTRMPASRSRSRTGALHFLSRSQISTR
jgi:hypothetical protein